MIVLAPVIWTVAVAGAATPAVTDLLAERYNVDLVPYYPLVLTAFPAADQHHRHRRAGGVPGPRRGRRGHAGLRGGDAGAAVHLLRVSRGNRRAGDDGLRRPTPSAILGPGLVPALIPIGLLG